MGIRLGSASQAGCYGFDPRRPLQFSEIILSLDFQSVKEIAETFPEFCVRECLSPEIMTLPLPIAVVLRSLSVSQSLISKGHAPRPILLKE